VGDPVLWDGSLEALNRVRREMPDCLLGYDATAGILHVRTEFNPEAAVPFGWAVTRVRDGIAAVTPGTWP
jgi:hypothetical protein